MFSIFYNFGFVRGQGFHDDIAIPLFILCDTLSGIATVILVAITLA